MAKENFENYALLSGILYKDFTQNVSFTANYAEALSVVFSIKVLINQPSEKQEIDTAIGIFEELFSKTKRDYYKQKSAICEKMKSHGADLKALIIEMSGF